MIKYLIVTDGHAELVETSDPVSDVLFKEKMYSAQIVIKLDYDGPSAEIVKLKA